MPSVYHATNIRSDVAAQAKFLGSLWDEKHGLETLAIVYSLPHAFLVWGCVVFFPLFLQMLNLSSSMILFFVALSAEWWHPGNLVSWVVIGTATVTVSILIGWCIWTARDRSDYWWFQADPGQASLVDNQTKDEERRDDRYRPLHGITSFASALFHKLNINYSAERSNGTDVEMSLERPAGNNSDVPSAYGQHRDTSCHVELGQVTVNIRQPTPPSDDPPFPASFLHVTPAR